MQEQSRIRQIVSIDVGAALGSREGLKYVKPPPLINEAEVRDDGPLTPMATVAPIQVSRTWIPSRVRVDYFRKDPYCILDRVAAATSTNISLYHSDSKDNTIRVSADVAEKVDDAMEKLGKLDSLLALINTPHRAFASYVPDTFGLRFGILELAQLNEIAPRRILVDPKSQIKYSIPGFLVPVSCRIDPSTNSFRISEHLRNPTGIESPVLGGNRQTIRCWSGFTYPAVGKPGENRGAQYSGLVVVYQPTLPGAERAAVGKSQARTSASVKQGQEVDTKVNPPGPSRRSLETIVSEKTARIGRPPLASRFVSSSSKLPGVKTRRPVLPDGRVPLTKAKAPARSSTPADSEKSTQSESQCSDAQKKGTSEVFGPRKRQPSLLFAKEVLEETRNSIDVVEKPQMSPERPLSTGSSSVSSSKFNFATQAATSSSQPVSRTVTTSGARREQRKLIGLFDKEPVIAGDWKTAPASSRLDVASSSETSSTSPVSHSVNLTIDNAPCESTAFQAASSQISDALSECAVSRDSETLRLLPGSTQSPVPTGYAVSNEDQETPRPMRSLPLTPKGPFSLPADDQSTPQLTRSLPVPPAEISTTPDDSIRGTRGSTESPSSVVTSNPVTAQATGHGGPTTQMNWSPSCTVSPHSVSHEAWFQGLGIVFGVPTQGPLPLGHDMYVPVVPSPCPGHPIILQPIYCPTYFPGFTAPMHPPALATSGPSQWSTGQAPPISQQQQLPGTTFQQGQTHGQYPSAPSLDHGGASESIAASADATTATSGDTPRPRSHSIVPQSHRDPVERPIQERLADPDDGDKKDFHSVMNQRTPNPSGNTKESSQSESKAKGKKRWTFFDINYTIKSDDTPTSVNPLPPKGRPHSSPAHAGFVKEVYRALAPILTTAQVFPGPLELEIQIGIVTMMNKLGAAEQSYMSFEEMKEVIYPRGELNRPSTIFLGRLTTLPADIDYILNLRPDGARLFDNDPSTLTIDYEFHCVLKNGLPLVISIDEKGDPTVKKPEAILGSVHISYPDRIWDAAALLHGHFSPHGKLDPEVERAVQYIAKNLWVEPNRSSIRLLTRVDNNILSVKKVILKRISYHRCTNDRYLSDIGGGIAKHGLQLRVTEGQDLKLTARQSDCDILEAVCESLDEMVTAHRQWWEIALISPSIQTALSQGAPTTIGDNHRNWCPIDILGIQTGLITGAPASPTAQSISHYGLGSLLALATAVVENIDPVGYSNAGPAGDRNKGRRMKLLEWK
ncbi:hypothetical protein PoHVEF18_004342 [Penicillium ochrochloron]